MKRFIIIISLLALVAAAGPARLSACTSVIVSGRVTSDGKPLMLKNRDQKDFDNILVGMKGEKYSFVGVRDHTMKVPKSVVGGTNEAGLSIMSTSIKNTEKANDRKWGASGKLIAMGLGSCSTVEEFEELLNKLEKPDYKSSFGVIDARGGAAYFQCNKGKWYKLDVNDPSVAPDGWKVVSNYSDIGSFDKFSRLGGFARREEGEYVMRTLNLSSLTPWSLLDAFCRTWYNVRMGVNFSRDYDTLVKKGWFNGTAYDSDFIARHSTVSTMVFQGAEKPVMWTVLGNPACGVMIPVPVLDAEYLPSYMLPAASDGKSALCSLCVGVKDRLMYLPDVSNGTAYVRLDNLLRGTQGRPAVLDCVRAAESRIRDLFLPLYAGRAGMNAEEFALAYARQSEEYFRIFKEEFAPLL